MTTLLNEFGPTYPSLGATVAKYRKIANPSPEQRRAHGDAVSGAIRSLQKQELQRGLPSFKPSCASGTWHNNSDGSVGRAVREQQARKLISEIDRLRKARPVHEIELAYARAMRDKRARATP